jgi:hypothetical protein
MSQTASYPPAMTHIRTIAVPAVSGMLLLCLLRFCPLPQYVQLPRAPDEIPRLTPNEWLGLGITLGLMAIVAIPIYRFALRIARCRKQRLLDVYLQPDSSFRPLLSGNMAAHVKATATTLAFAPLTYLAAYSYGWPEIIGITAAMTVGLVASAYLGVGLKSQIIPARLALLRISTFLWTGVLVSTLILAAIKLLNDSSVITAEITDQAIEKEVLKTQHPVHGVEILLRGQRYFDLYLLKARGLLPGGIGILLYVFFFLPAALPLLAVAYTFGGARYVAE